MLYAFCFCSLPIYATKETGFYVHFLFYVTMLFRLYKLCGRRWSCATGWGGGYYYTLLV